MQQQQQQLRDRMASDAYSMSDRDPIVEKEAEEADEKRKNSKARDILCGNVTQSECQLLFLLILALFVLIALATIMLVMNRRISIQCLDSNCAVQAAEMGSVMNKSAPVCSDFHNYACGNWDKVFLTQPGVGKYSGFYKASRNNMLRLYSILHHKRSHLLLLNGKRSSAVLKAVEYFNACVNTTARSIEGPKAAKKLIAELGGWSLTPSIASTAFASTDVDIFEKIATANSMLASPFFTVSPSVSQFNLRRRAFSINQGFAPYQRSALLSDQTKFRNAYVAYGQQVIRALGETVSTATNERLQQLWQLEMKLERLRNSYVQRRQVGLVLADRSKYEMTLSQLSARVSSHLKSKTGKSTTSEILNAAITLSPKFLGVRLLSNSLIRVENQNYLFGLASIFYTAITTNTTLLSDYVVMTTLRSFVHSFGSEFKEAMRQEKQLIYGNNVLDNLWYYCTLKTDYAFKFATSAVVVQQTITPKAVKKVETMVEKIQAMMLVVIRKASWMDSVTRERALTKAKKIKKVVAFPPFILDQAKLDAFYDDLPVVKNDYINSYYLIRKRKRHWSIDRLSRLKPHHGFEWSFSPLTANAFYSQVAIRITILAGIMQPPFFNEAFQDAFNYGAIGSIIGHELSHAFDARGRYYGHTGRLQFWWTNATSRGYEKREKCFVQQYSEYTAYGVHNKGRHTVEENMADNGGLRIAIETFKRILEEATDDKTELPGLKLKPMQIFFLAFAQLWCGHVTQEFGRKLMETDVHSVYQHRVLGTLSNMPEFAEAFNCPKNSPYNPSKRCSLWS